MNSIIRLFISIFMVINVILYPIGVTLTSPKVMNEIFDTIKFEKVFLDSYKALVKRNVEEELPEGEDSEEYNEIIDNAFISEKKLREQRVENVNKFYKSLDNNEVPEVVFSFENPLFKIKNNINSLSDKLRNYIVQFGQSLDCENNENSLKCKMAGKIIPVQEEKETENVKDEVEKMMTLKTSLGIDKNNLKKITTVYKFLKYGPEALIVLTIALMIIGYVLNYPKLKFARKLIFTFIKVDVLALMFWGLVPLLIKGMSPLKVISSSDLLATNDLNKSLGDILVQMSKRAILMPVLFTVGSVGIYFLLMFIKRSQKGMEKALEKAEQRDVPDDDMAVDQKESQESSSQIDDKPEQTQKKAPPVTSASD